MSLRQQSNYGSCIQNKRFFSSSDTDTRVSLLLSSLVVTTQFRQPTLELGDPIATCRLDPVLGSTRSCPPWSRSPATERSPTQIPGASL
eukprot:767422-Hanusia_phi.AAC.1